MSELSRRNLVIGGAGAGIVGVLGVGGVIGWNQRGTTVRTSSDAVAKAEAARRGAGRNIVAARLTPQPMTVDLGGRTVQTWGYGDSLPGPVLRAKAGDLMRVVVDNQLNGFPDAAPLPVKQGERVRLRFQNRTMMFHPMHLHGHTFGLVSGGARKDTVIVRPMQTVDVDLNADNPGQWPAHCHNIYHAEAGMMTTLSYET